MENRRFDALTRRLATGQSRRAAAALVGSLLAAPLLAPPSAARKNKKKTALCLNGQTLQASKKTKKKLLKAGASLGACPPTTTTTATPAPTTTTPPPPFCLGKNICEQATATCALDQSCFCFVRAESDHEGEPFCALGELSLFGATTCDDCGPTDRVCVHRSGRCDAATPYLCVAGCPNPQ
jgi:hypothetical protein